MSIRRQKKIRLDTGSVFQQICLVAIFPGKTFVLAAKVAICCCFSIFDFVRVEQIEHGENAVRAQIKMLSDKCCYLCLLYTSDAADE